MKNLLLTLILLISCFSLINAQEVGKIISAKEADALFGKVTEEVTITLSALKDFSSKTKEYVMLNIIDKQLHVLGDSRRAITSISEKLDSKTVLHVFSKSKVDEFISKSESQLQTTGTNSINIQIRGDKLMLSNGFDVLEFSQACPPFCG